MPGPADTSISAEALVSLVSVAPQRAVDAARSILEHSTDLRERALAGRALGIGLRVLGDATVAEATLRDAVSDATAAKDPRLLALAEMTLAVTLLYRGLTTEAFDLLDTAQSRVGGVERALVMSEKGGALLRMGRFDDGFALLDEALPVLLESGDALDAADLLTNRGIARTFLGDFVGARSDLEQAYERYDAAGYQLYAARMIWNLAFVAGREGSIAHALTLFDEAATRIEEAGGLASELAGDRCQVLLTAGLGLEAHALARRAAGDCRAGGRDADLAEVLLLVSRCALAAGELGEAVDAANEAATLFLAQGRDSWARQADILACRATLEAGSVEAGADERLHDHARALELVDRRAALEASVLRMLMFVRAGSAEAAADAHRAIPDELPIELEVIRALATAELARASGAPAEARDAVNRAFEAIHRQRAVLTSTELRASVARHVVGLARLGVAIAMDSNEPSVLVEALEDQRSQSLRYQRLLPPSDPVLADLLTRLRTLLDRTGSGNGDETARERQALERSIRERAWAEEGLMLGSARSASLAEIDSRRERGETIVEIFTHDGTAHAVVIDDEGARTVAITAASSFERIADLLPRAYWRVVSRVGDERLHRQAVAQLSTLMESMDEHLRPLVGGNVRVVLCPPAHLASVPWRLLDCLRSRRTTVVPSLTMLTQLRRAGHRGASRVLGVAGPRLGHADDEVQRICATHVSARRLIGAEATTDLVLKALAEADVAHIACHGQFRQGNPMLSCLLLDDGALTVYDLERATRLPEVVVLSACHLGMAAATAGDEVLGLTHALLGMGTRSVIASVTPTPDSPATVELMVALHRHLADGADAAEALHRASTEVGAEGELIAGAFVAFGA